MDGVCINIHVFAVSRHVLIPDHECNRLSPETAYHAVITSVFKYQYDHNHDMPNVQA